MIENSGEKELIIAKEEFTEDAEKLAKIVEDGKALHVYKPFSKAPFVIGTLVPRNLEFEIKKSFKPIVDTYKDIDRYVMTGLRYPSKEELWKALAAEQVDAIALYLYQFENDQGIIIGDQAGIGKGRQAASVIRHAVLNGYLPIFCTKSPDLFTDIYRDLKAINFGDISPFIINTTNNANIKDEKGNVIFSPLSNESQIELITTEVEYAIDSPESINWHKQAGIKLPDAESTPYITLLEPLDYLPKGYNMIFCSYSQIQSAHPYKRDWLEKLIKRGVFGSKTYQKVIFITDESHMAGGYDSIIGKWIRNVLPHSKACCYLSATFAKYPDVMPLYAKKTAILETNMSDYRFVRAMKGGGLALQEIVASNLAESGQLIRRQRSNKGIKIDYITLNSEPERSKNRASVDRIIKIMNDIVAFEEAYVMPIKDAIHYKAKVENGRVSKGVRGLGVNSTPYFSRVFNIIDQMLFSLKVKEVAEKTIDLLNEDKKVVIAFKSTMGAYLKDLNLISGQEIPAEGLDFTRTLEKGLQSILSYGYTDITGEKSRVQIPIDALGANGKARYNEIKKRIKLEATGLTISPIDELISIIESSQKPSYVGGHSNSNYKVAEVTGRKQRIDLSDDIAVVESYSSNTEESFRLFNEGKIDVLLINQSGSTGFSAHSSKEFKDQRQRAMIIHQFELDIYVEIQKRGRINRTGQVNLPEYYYITSDIPTEKRLMTMLKGKLKSLDANTTGSQNTNEDTLKSPDIFNKYGDQAAWDWITQNSHMMSVLGYPTHHKEEGIYVRNKSRDGAIRQLTGRAGLLMVDAQEKLYNDLISQYNHIVKVEKQNGTYDLEVEYLPLDAEVKQRFLYEKGNGGTTPFGKDTIRDVTIINNLKRPLLKSEIDDRIENTLNGQKPSQIRIGIEKHIAEEFPKVVEKRVKKRESDISKLEKEFKTLPEVDSDLDVQENEKIKNDIDKAQKLIDKKKASLEKVLTELTEVKKTILKYINFWNTGDVVRVPHIGSDLMPSWGIFLGVKYDYWKTNPFTLGNFRFEFAVTDSRKVMTFDLKPDEQLYLSQIFVESKDISEDDIKRVNFQWNEMIKLASKKREKRHILTENIIRACDVVGTKNKLVKYNTRDGVIKNGILMHKSFEKDMDGIFYALAPISNAKDKINALEIDEFIQDHTANVRFVRKDENYLQVFLSKKNLYEVSLDSKLRRLIRKEDNQDSDELANFVQNASEMTGTLHIENLEPFLKQLDTFDIKYHTEAREMEDWEIENKEDWEAKTKKLKGKIFKYRLGKKYGADSNPSFGLVEYIEPQTQSSSDYGFVTYNRKLNTREKYNYTLYPVFESVEEPFNEWKTITSKSALADQSKYAIAQARELPLHYAIEKLGYYILNNLHEDANPEFVIGDYSVYDLGRVFYEDSISEIDQLDEFLSQLQIAKEQ
ncbi:strawberry notch C-terminal domain-containing protein [Kordia jejudonensis]|uniref:strawberry notch C-terminal domain-containing protein n=1 Tax=Kordia jejudonensis TaxID=1348245 RepID=UPI0006290391|nr:strawberry notch C-terminal domain-containing protein [Kordia jejudonensis]